MKNRSAQLQAIYDNPETRAEVCELLATAWILGYDAHTDLVQEAEVLDGLAEDFDMPKALEFVASNPFSDDPDMQGKLILLDEAA